MRGAVRDTISIGELAHQLGGELFGPGELEISGVNALDAARPGEITFIHDRTYAGRWAECRASAAVISRRALSAAHHDETERALIVVEDAELASIELLRRFMPPPPRPELGVHPTAWVHPEAEIGADVRIGPHVSVDAGATVGARTVLHGGVRIYGRASIGADGEIHAGTVIRERCVIGSRVLFHQNVSIGGDGFGYRPAPDGRGLIKMPHLGLVRIEDDVEIGAGSCVDRAKFNETVIGAGTKIDNLVQIAHNCRIGRMCVIAGQTGLAGSVVVGDGVQIGGQVAIAEHVRIGDGARIGARSGVMRDIEPGESVLGLPAEPVRVTLRQAAALRKLPGLLHEISRRGRGSDAS